MKKKTSFYRYTVLKLIVLAGLLLPGVAYSQTDYTFPGPGDASINISVMPGGDQPQAAQQWTVTGNANNNEVVVNGNYSCTNCILDNNGGTLTITIPTGNTLTINGTLTLSNAVTIQGDGDIEVQGFAGTEPTIANNLNMTVNNAGAVTLPTTVHTNIANFTKTGAGVLTVGHDINCSGTLTISAGTYSATNTTTCNALSVSGTYSTTNTTTCNSLAANGTITATGQTINVNAGAVTSTSGTIDCADISAGSYPGSANIDWTFTPGAGSYNIPAALTSFKSLAFAPTGAADFTVQNTNLSVTNALTTNASTELKFNITGTRSISAGSMTIGGQITKEGTGQLNAPNTLKGGQVDVDAGTLNYTGTVDFGANVVNVNSGTLSVSGNLTCGGTVTLASGTSLSATGTASITTLTASASASNVSIDYFSNSPTINNPQNVNFTFNDIGATYTLPFNTANNLTVQCSGTSTITLPDANITFSNAINYNGGTFIWEMPASGTKTLSASGSNFPTFNMTGGGTLTINSTPSFGTLDLQSGSLTVQNDISISTALTTAVGTTFTADMTNNAVTITCTGAANFGGAFATTAGAGNNFELDCGANDIISNQGFTVNTTDNNTMTFTCNTFSKTGGDFTFTGAAGNETLEFSNDYDQSAGDFSFTGNAGDDVLDIGNDFTQSGNNFTFTGGAGDDDITGVRRFTMSGNDFTFTGGTGDDSFTSTQNFVMSGNAFTFNGGDGNDDFACGRTYTHSGTGNFSFDGGDGNDGFACTREFDQTSGNFAYTGGAGDDDLTTGWDFTFDNNTGTFSFDGGTDTDALTSSQDVEITTSAGAGKLAITDSDVNSGGAYHIYLTADGTNTNDIALDNSTLTGQDIELTGQTTLTCPVVFDASRDLTFNSTVTNAFTGACVIDLVADEIIIPGGTTINYQAGGAGENLNVYTDNLTVNGTLNILSQVNGTLDIKAEDGVSDLPLINVNATGTLNINCANNDITVKATAVNLNGGGDINLLTNTNKVTLEADNLTITEGTLDAHNDGDGNSEIIVNTLLTMADDANAILDLRGGTTVVDEIAKLTLMEGAVFGAAATIHTDKQDNGGDAGEDDAGSFIYIDKGSTTQITLHPDMQNLFRLYIFSATGALLGTDIVVGEFDLDESDTDGDEGRLGLNGYTFQLNKYLDAGDDLGIIDASGSALDLTAIFDNVNMGPSEITFISDADTDLLIEDIVNSDAADFVITLPALSQISNFRSSLADNSTGNVKLVLSSDLFVNNDFYLNNQDDNTQEFEFDLNGHKLTVKEDFSADRDLNNPNSKTILTAYEGGAPSGTFCGFELRGNVDFSNFEFNVGATASTDGAFDLTINEWGNIDSVLDFVPAGNKYIRHIIMDRALPTLKIADPTIASLTINAGHVDFFDDGGGAGTDYEVEGDVFINDGGFLKIGDQNEGNGFPTIAKLCTEPGASMTGTGVFQAMGYGGNVELTFGDITEEHSGAVYFNGTWYSDDAIDVTFATKIENSDQTQYLNANAIEYKSLTFLADDEGNGNRFRIIQRGDIELAETLSLGDAVAGNTGIVQYTVYGNKLTLGTDYNDFDQSYLDASNSVIDFGGICTVNEGELIFDDNTTAVFRGTVTADASDQIWTLKNLHLYNNVAKNAGGQLTLLADMTITEDLIITADNEGDGDDGKLTSDGFNITVMNDFILGPEWNAGGDGILFDCNSGTGGTSILQLYGQFYGGEFSGMFANTDQLRLEILE